MKGKNDIAAVREATRKLVREFDVFRNVKSQLDISLSQCHTLIEIEKSGSLTVNDLARILGLNKSSTSRILSSLKKQEYITRLKNEDDSRIKPFALTEKGIEKLKLINQDANTKAYNALESLTEAQKKTIVEGMELYARALKSSRFVNNTEIRSLAESDVTTLKKVFLHIITPYNSYAFHEGEIKILSKIYNSPGNAYKILEYEGNIIGGGGIASVEKGSCQIKKFFILPEYRNLGLGTKLIDCLQDVAKDMDYKKMYVELHEKMVDAYILLERNNYSSCKPPSHFDDKHTIGWMFKKL